MIGLYAFIGRALFALSYPFLRLMGRRLTGTRVRVLVMAPTGRILLVKTWFGAQRWSLSGGGITRHESPEMAAVRELREETGISADASQLVFVGEVSKNEGLPFHLLVYRLSVSAETLETLDRGRRLEIIGRKWVETDALPPQTSEAVEWALKRER